MQYLPVVFAVFQVFFLTGLIIYYMAQAILRIGQQAYITRKFYGHEESLGRQAQRAGDQARELAKQDGGTGGGGLFGQAKRDIAAKKADAPSKSDKSAAPPAKKDPKAIAPAAEQKATKRTTAPKGRPTPTGKAATARPTPSSSSGRPGGSRAKSGDKRRR
jgi:YidC/Oxa1 family membrane protein insertase